jgi:lipopolysaccharide cholinephosphotransferase
MMREDYEKFLRIAPLEFPPDVFLQTKETDPFYDYIPLPCKVRDLNSLHIALGQENKKYARGIFVDVFPVDRYHKGNPALFIEKALKWCNYVASRGMDAEYYKHQSRKSLFLSYFKPVFLAVKLRYDKIAGKIIRENGKLGENCLLGRGFDIIWCHRFAYDDIFPLGEIAFEGHTFYAPRNTGAYLTRFYGKDYMTPPPPEQRRPGHYIILKPALE